MLPLAAKPWTNRTEGSSYPERSGQVPCRDPRGNQATGQREWTKEGAHSTIIPTTDQFCLF